MPPEGTKDALGGAGHTVTGTRGQRCDSDMIRRRIMVNKQAMHHLLPFMGGRKGGQVKMVVALTALVFAMTAVFVLSFASCKGTAGEPAIIWINLYGPTPELSFDESGTPTATAATLSLDFSEPIADLRSGLSASELNMIFSFVYYKAGSANPSAMEIRAVSLTPDEVGGKNTYKLKVSGAPADSGRVEVTINTSRIQPAVRSWPLNGSHDYSVPAILDFRFLTPDGVLIGAPGSITPGSGTRPWTIAVTVPADTDIRKLMPTIILNPGNIVSPDKDIEQDFTNKITYSVMAEDGSSTKTYAVTVTPAP
jgi:hypothetical protein